LKRKLVSVIVGQYELKLQPQAKVCKIPDGWSQISADIPISRIITETKKYGTVQLIASIFG